MAAQEARAEVTAAERGEGEGFFPLHLAIMQPGTTAPIDLYLKEHNPPRFLLYKRAETPLTDEIRQRLREHGVEELYIRSEDEEAFYDYVEEQIDAIIADDLLPPERVWPIVYQSASRTMRQVFDSPRAGGNIKRAVQLVDSVVESALKSEDPLNDITALIAHDYYTYTHSVNVCVFLVATGKELLGVTAASALKRVARGAVLHDIGKSQIPAEIINKKGKLDPDEWELMQQHPELGLELAGRYISLSDVAADIIRHHHEHCDGSGYPEGLEGTQIRPIVQLSTVVDVYDALTTRRSYAEASAPYSALRIMVEEMKGHFSMPVVRAFIRFLGPEEYSRDARVHQPTPEA